MGDDLISSDEVSRLWRARRTVSKMLSDRKYLIDEQDVEMNLEDFKARFAQERAGAAGYTTSKRHYMASMYLSARLCYFRTTIFVVVVVVCLFFATRVIVHSRPAYSKHIAAPHITLSTVCFCVCSSRPRMTPPKKSTSFSLQTRKLALKCCASMTVISVPRGLTIFNPHICVVVPFVHPCPTHSLAKDMDEQQVSRSILVLRGTMTPMCRQILAGEFRDRYNMEQFTEEELLVNITEHHLVPKHQVLLYIYTYIFMEFLAFNTPGILIFLSFVNCFFFFIIFFLSSCRSCLMKTKSLS